MELSSLVNWWHNLTEMIFFERCRACGNNLRQDLSRASSGLQAVCAACWQEVAGRPPLFQWCRLGEGPCFPIASGAYYRGPLKKLIYKLKYDKDRLLTGDLKRLLQQAWSRLLPAVITDSEHRTGDLILVPIPLHPSRERLRGFNHATLLAREFAAALNIPLEVQALRRVKKTAPQHGLKRWQRIENLDGAFECSELLVKGKSVVLVDDIYTSGATLAEAARITLSAGARKVSGLTVARAV